MSSDNSYYVATKMDLKWYAAAVRDMLVANGFEVTSRWIDSEAKWFDRSDGEYALNWAAKDAEDVLRADRLMVLAPEEGGVGCWVELGIAIGAGKPIDYIGPRDRSVFSYHPLVTYYKSVEEFIKAMQERRG